MQFTMVPLLIHSDAVPAGARDALRAALVAPPELRQAELESAARVLFHETELDCGDVRELVGLRSLASCQ